MKNLLLLLPAFLYFTSTVWAQKEDLYARPGENGLYIEHKVMPKENFYSLSRLYNIQPRAIADLNKVDMNKGLFIDQKIKIPLTDSNFTQTGNSGTPVYYKAGEKDAVGGVSAMYRVSSERIRYWNDLNGEELKKGQKIIIGFLLSKAMTSITIKRPAEEKMAGELPAKEEIGDGKIAEPKTVEKKEPVSSTVGGEEKIPVVKEEKTTETNEGMKKVETIIVNEPVKPVVEGYFKSHFDQQGLKTPVSKDATVTAGIFKTASGWQDAKFYMLIDGVLPGTIIRIINPTNNKVIYAKVLGQMKGIRQNEGLDIRMSNAAAAALDIAETEKFIVRLNY